MVRRTQEPHLSFRYPSTLRPRSAKMSRRPAPPDRTEQNRATLKQLVKLEGNKSCCDCKRNKHPRWASWNLGIFVCIRCSGIHRGMGTHISRVKSVDLDSWTDEQLQSMLKWGNARANKYWEAKLAPGHVPSEAKIENFIRTKYDSKRWVMDGGMPDPSTLDVEGDDDVPLNVVQEKAKMERSASIKNGTSGSLPQPPRVRPQDVDLFGDDSSPVPARPSTTEPRPAPVKAPVAPPKQTRPNESLLGLDFFGGTQSAPPRPSSAQSGLAGTSGVPGRTDLKQSILSLYSSAPRQAAPSQPASNASAFGGMTSPPLTSPTQQPSNSAALGDAFSSLSFSSPPPQQQAKPAPFSNLSSPQARQPSSISSAFGGGGSFFDSKPAPPPKPTSPPAQFQARKVSDGFGDFGGFSSGPSPPVSRAPPPASSTMGDLFDISAPAPAPAAPAKPAIRSPAAAPPSYSQSAFNLSQPTPAPVPKPPAQTQISSNMDAWGSSDVWGAPDPPSQPQAVPPPQTSTSTFKPPPPTPQMSMPSAYDSGWGAPTPTAAQPTVKEDDDFGGWSHASPVATTSGPKQGGVGGNADDLFGNVWE